MKKILFACVIILVTSCSKERNDLTVKTSISGLKKGIVYLKKIKDSTLITVDSIIINGKSEFELFSKIESPEVFFLHLDKNSSENDRIAFFADKGLTEIKTSLKNFVFDAKINGSPQQKKWEEYQVMRSRFNDANLDLIKENFEAQRNGDTIKKDSIDKVYNNLLKRKYLYTVNFALNNRDSEVAPYLALTEIYDARLKFLDTINNALSKKVKESKYGLELQNFLDKIKKEEIN